MPLNISDETKVNILLKHIEINRKEVEWLKDLDFKTINYTVTVYVGLIAWLVVNKQDIQANIAGQFIVVVWGIAIFGSMLLARNHIRHRELNQTLNRLQKALNLMAKHEYSDDEIFKDKPSGMDVEFHLGRLIYLGII